MGLPIGTDQWTLPNWNKPVPSTTSAHYGLAGRASADISARGGRGTGPRYPLSAASSPSRTCSTTPSTSPPRPCSGTSQPTQRAEGRAPAARGNDRSQPRTEKRAVPKLTQKLAIDEAVGGHAPRRAPLGQENDIDKALALALGEKHWCSSPRARNDTSWPRKCQPRSHPALGHASAYTGSRACTKHLGGLHSLWEEASW